MEDDALPEAKKVRLEDLEGGRLGVAAEPILYGRKKEKKEWNVKVEKYYNLEDEE